MQRSKRKDLKVYCVYYSCNDDYEGYQNGNCLLGIYFSKEVALHGLIDALNFEYEAEISEYTEESLNNFDIGYEASWRIEEVIVNDKEKLMEVV